MPQLSFSYGEDPGIGGCRTGGTTAENSRTNYPGATIMGDKSPKSMKKLANQKDVKAQEDNRKKKAAIDAKRKEPPKKK